MWYQHRGSGRLHAAGTEKTLLYSTFEERAQAESSSREVDMWLSTSRATLLQSKGRAAEARHIQRKQQRRQKKQQTQQRQQLQSERRQQEELELQQYGSEDSEWNAGYSSADSAGDDESVESMILDPGDDIFGLLE